MPARPAGHGVAKPIVLCLQTRPWLLQPIYVLWETNGDLPPPNLMKIGPSGTPPLPNQSPIFNFFTSRGGILRGLGKNSDVIVCLKDGGFIKKEFYVLISLLQGYLS